jgi:hypothetical protein
MKPLNDGELLLSSSRGEEGRSKRLSKVVAWMSVEVGIPSVVERKKEVGRAAAVEGQSAQKMRRVIMKRKSLRVGVGTFGGENWSKGILIDCGIGLECGSRCPAYPSFVRVSERLENW